MRLLLKINDIYFLCARPDIRIDEPIFHCLLYFRQYSLSCLQTFYLCLPSWHSHSLTPHICACVSECVCAWVSECFTNKHTHTHTHTLFKPFYLLRHTLCAKKSLHSLNLFIRSSNHFGTSFSQQPLWYLSLSLLIALIFLVAQKYLENLGFSRYFWKEK